MIDIDIGLFQDRIKEITGGAAKLELTEIIGVTQATGSRHLSDPGGKMTLNEIYRIAKKYNCSVDYLLGLSDDPGPRHSGSGPAAAVPGFDGFDGVPAPADLCALLSALDQADLARVGSREENIEAAFYGFDGFLDFSPLPSKSEIMELRVLSCDADFIADYINEIRTGGLSGSDIRMRLLCELEEDPRAFIKKYAGTVNSEFYDQIARRAYIETICNFCMVYDKSKSVFDVLPAPDAATLVGKLCEISTDKYYNLVAAALFDGVTEYAQSKEEDQASE